MTLWTDDDCLPGLLIFLDSGNSFTRATKSESDSQTTCKGLAVIRCPINTIGRNVVYVEPAKSGVWSGIDKGIARERTARYERLPFVFFVLSCRGEVGPAGRDGKLLGRFSPRPSRQPNCHLLGRK